MGTNVARSPASPPHIRVELVLFPSFVMSVCNDSLLHPEIVPGQQNRVRGVVRSSVRGDRLVRKPCS